MISSKILKKNVVTRVAAKWLSSKGWEIVYWLHLAPGHLFVNIFQRHVAANSDSTPGEAILCFLDRSSKKNKILIIPTIIPQCIKNSEI